MPDLAIGFTASRVLGGGGRAVILNVLPQLPLADRYITGGARGGDAFIGRWLLENRPGAHHHVIVPGNKNQVDPWWLKIEGIVEITLMPTRSTYEDRNAAVVAASTAVCGFPAHIENHPRSQRSGSWQTIRMARRVGKLHRWDTVKWPFTGCIEKALGEFGYQEAGHG